MKKLFVIIITLLILLYNVCFAEDFSFHNGLKFGINEKEAITFEENENKTVFEIKDYWCGLKNLNMGKTTFAGETCKMFMSFNNDKLVSVVFDISANDERDFFDDIVSMLTEKYGSPKAINGSYVKDIPTKGYSAFNIYVSDEFQKHFNEEGYDSNYEKYWSESKILDSAQYVFEADNCYVDIECLLFNYSSNIGNGFSIDSNLISYSYIDKQEYEEVMKKQNEEEERKRNDI